MTNRPTTAILLSMLKYLHLTHWEANLSGQAMLKGAGKGRNTQWASQFLVAAELSRRGYVVSFTMGNTTPVADLMVGTTSGKQFWVDVKGLSSATSWFLKPKPDRINLFYILVLLSPIPLGSVPRKADSFFVLTQAEANRLEEAYRHARPHLSHAMPGFSFKDPACHRDRWDKLPLDN